jgi:hypothetical protein
LDNVAIIKQECIKGLMGVALEVAMGGIDDSDIEKVIS